MHLTSADLHLERLAPRPDHSRVQRLVQVELGHRDVVLEPALHRLPRRVDRPEGGVAVLHRVDDDPDADEVEDLVELPALHDHLLVDAPQVLRPAGDLRRDTQLRQAPAHLVEHVVEVLVSLGAARRHHVVDLGVALGMQRREREILELLLHLLHAEAMRQRCVDVERLLGGAALLVLGERGDRAHVVEPVGELDDQDPQVLGHRDEHLAHRGGLLLLLGVEANAFELRHAVDDRRDLLAELALHVVERDRRVLHRVMEECGRDRRLVEPELGDDAGDRNRVIDVALSRLTELLGVRGQPRPRRRA